MRAAQVAMLMCVHSHPEACLCLANAQRMGPKPLRPTSVPVPWPGHWHFSSGSPYFRQPFDADAYAATKRYLAMESLRVRM